MKIKTAYVVLIVCLSYSIHAQTLRRPIVTSYIGIGAYSVNHTDVFSFTCMPASLAQIKNITAGVYAERRFMLSELNGYTAAAALPARSGNFGLKTMYSGFSGYNETQIGLAYARKIGSKVDIGAQFNYNGIRIAGYGNASAISFEAGSIFHLSDKLHTGFHINNPVGGKFGPDSYQEDQQEKLPSVYTMGIGYDASEKFFFSTEIIKEEDQPVQVNAGIQYKFISQVLTRLGITSATSSIWFGLGFFLQSFRLDVTTSFHPQLGITPGLLIIFNRQPKTE